MLTTILSLILIASVNPLISPVPETKPLAVRTFSMENRYQDSFVNDVFRDNILLTIDYAVGKTPTRNVNWAEVVRPFEKKLILKPGETFAFHDDVMPKYAGKAIKTTNAHFGSNEGFKFSGKLWGDGVCHLASFLYWTAKDAGLDTVAPVRHDFAKIPEVPREYGVSIYSTPGTNTSDQAQNLYITNNHDKEIAFVFAYDGKNLKITAEENVGKSISFAK